jgi:hypothetical protein
VQFHANTVVVDDSDEDYILVGFADEADGRYRDSLVLQRSYEFDEQDVALGMDQVHIERNEQSRGGYGGILRFELRRDRVAVALDSRMAAQLGDDAFEITFAIDEDAFVQLRAGLRAVFRGFQSLQENGASE